jgi:hypothetical protein
MDLTFNSEYDLLCYLYDNNFLTSVDVCSDAGCDLLIELTPDPPSDQIKELVTSIFWGNFAHLTGDHTIKRNSKNELVTSIWRSEDVSLWDNVSTFSNDIMKLIGSHLSLPHELFEVSPKWDPAVFVELEMSCNDRKVDSFSIKYSDFDITDKIEDFGLSISCEEVMGIINKGDTPGLADAIKDYVLGILDADDEEATGFDLTLSEFNIQHLHIYSDDQIALKDWLSEREDIKVTSFT